MDRVPPLDPDPIEEIVLAVRHGYYAEFGWDGLRADLRHFGEDRRSPLLQEMEQMRAETERLREALREIAALNDNGDYQGGRMEGAAPLTKEAHRLAWEWADGKWLGDGWMDYLPLALQAEAYWRVETERLRKALREIADNHHLNEFAMTAIAARALRATEEKPA